MPDRVGRNVPANVVAVAQATAASQVIGGLMLATGRMPRVASAVLAATVIPANLGKHMFWAEDDPEAKAEKRRGFLADVSLVGGLILASADTAGKPSLGWRGRRAGRRVAETLSAAVHPDSDGLLSRVPELSEKLEKTAEKAAPLAESAYRMASERAAELASSARELTAKARA